MNNISLCDNSKPNSGVITKYFGFLCIITKIFSDIHAKSGDITKWGNLKTEIQLCDNYAAQGLNLMKLNCKIFTNVKI